MVPGTGSAAIYAGIDTTQAPYYLTTDQRGLGFPRSTGGQVDIGAVESENPIPTTYISVTGTGGSGGAVIGGSGTQVNPFQATTLSAAVADADQYGVAVIDFAPSLTGSGPAIIDLTTAADGTAGPSAFGIDTDITIVGATGGNGITLETNGNMRLFYVATTGDLTIESLTLAGGDAQGGSSDLGGGGAGMGGAIFNQGTLTVMQSTLTGNIAEGGSGGIGSVTGAAAASAAPATRRETAAARTADCGNGSNGGFGGGGGYSPYGYAGFGGFGGGGGGTAATYRPVPAALAAAAAAATAAAGGGLGGGYGYAGPFAAAAAVPASAAPSSTPPAPSPSLIARWPATPPGRPAAPGPATAPASAAPSSTSMAALPWSTPPWPATRSPLAPAAP